MFCSSGDRLSSAPTPTTSNLDLFLKLVSATKILWTGSTTSIFFPECQPECQFMHVSFLILYASCMWMLKIIRWHFCCLYVGLCASLQKSYMHTILNVSLFVSFTCRVGSFYSRKESFDPLSELVFQFWLRLLLLDVFSLKKKYLDWVEAKFAEFVLVESIYFRFMTPKSSET